MYFREHEPKRVHAERQALEGGFDFDVIQIAGNITSRNALELIRQWGLPNRVVPDANWSKIRPVSRSIGFHRWSEVGTVFLPHVARADSEAALRTHPTFNDGSQGSVDFESWLAGLNFEPCKDTAYSRGFFLDGGTVAWPNGADIASEPCTTRAAPSSPTSG